MTYIFIYRIVHCGYYGWMHYRFVRAVSKRWRDRTLPMSEGVQPSTRPTQGASTYG